MPAGHSTAVPGPVPPTQHGFAAHFTRPVPADTTPVSPKGRGDIFIASAPFMPQFLLCPKKDFLALDHFLQCPYHTARLKRCLHSVPKVSTSLRHTDAPVFFTVQIPCFHTHMHFCRFSHSKNTPKIHSIHKLHM